jgi:ABC-2 type transport system permease protein
MSADVWTVLWKDWKEIMSQGGGKNKYVLLVYAGVFGIFLPLQTGIAWLTEPLLLIYWVWIPLFLVSTVIADSFAGERERHTLETLLASRLSDRAILFGKILAAIAYGWGLSMACILLGVVTINLTFGKGVFLFYPTDVMIGIVAVSFLGSSLASCVGVLVSLRAATVRQAQQTLSISMMIVFFLLLFGLQALPDGWREILMSGLSGMTFLGVVGVISAGLLVLDLILLAAAMARFQRARLILD